jgi:hypothetical protein
VNLDDDTRARLEGVIARLLAGDHLGG